MRKPSVVFVIPCFNEGEVIFDTLRPIIDAGHKVVCVDDASHDQTKEIASKAGAIVIKHMINAGQGASLQTGFDYILQSPHIFSKSDFVATFDGDGQHSLADLGNFLKVFEGNPHLDIALGSRFLGSEFQGSKNKYYILKTMAFVSKFTIGIHVTDRHNGFRLIRKESLALFNLKSPGYEHADEFLHIISKYQLKYTEVATNIQYTKYSLSKGQPIINGFKMLFDRFMNGWK